MAGGMNRRGERAPLHERIHGARPPSATEDVVAPASTATLRHCWVADERRQVPGLLLEWRRTRTAGGWEGRVVRPVLDGGAWIAVEEWLPASMLSGA